MSNVREERIGKVQQQDLRGRVFAVTGGNSGIGKGIAGALARHGATVAILARRVALSEEAAASLSSGETQSHFAVECNVASQISVDAALRVTVDRAGRLDGCVACAGITDSMPFLDLSAEGWRRVVSVNLDGTFYLLQGTARHLVERGEGGAMVAVSSILANYGRADSAHYVASKAAIIALVRSAAVALARHEIRVNALLPGWTVTGMTELAHQNARFRSAETSRTPAARWADADEYGDVATYLCNPAFPFHTGDVITVDGGYSAY